MTSSGAAMLATRHAVFEAGNTAAFFHELFQKCRKGIGMALEINYQLILFS
jgi:hypothetical protein